MKHVDVPVGFPHKLSDAELEYTSSEIAAAMLDASGLRGATSGSGEASERAYLEIYATLHDAGRAEQHRRSFRRSERLARLALCIAILSAIVATGVSAASLTKSLADPTAESVYQLRREIAADSGKSKALLRRLVRESEKQTNLLNQIRLDARSPN